MNSKLFQYAGIAASVVLIAFGIGAVVIGLNGRDRVATELGREQIVGTPDSTIPNQLVNTGGEAQAFAKVMRKHTLEATGGKTYAQLSAASLAQPDNTKLAGEVATVFKGETLRSMLLNAFGWWKVSQITFIASLVAFGLGGLLGTVAVDVTRLFLGSPIAAYGTVFAAQAVLFVISAVLAARVGLPGSQSTVRLAVAGNASMAGMGGR